MATLIASLRLSVVARWYWQWRACWKERYAVTHSIDMDALGATGTIPVHTRVVYDDDLITASGVTCGLDLGLYLLFLMLIFLSPKAPISLVTYPFDGAHTSPIHSV